MVIIISLRISRSALLFNFLAFLFTNIIYIVTHSITHIV